MNTYRSSFFLLATAVIFSSCTKQQPAADPEVMMAKLAKEAVAEAKEKYSTVLDFQFASVQRVDSILGVLHNTHSDEPLPENEINRQSYLWGAYVGEVIKLKRPFHWERDSEMGKETFPLVSEKNEKLFPTAWCYKRIINGNEDNVWFKTRISLSD